MFIRPKVVCSGVFLLSVAVSAIAGEAQTLITAASATRLRSEPRIDARVVAELSLGTDLVICGEEAEGWVRVETRDGRAGWISTALVTSMPASGGHAVVDELIRARLGRSSDGLAPRLELAALVERAMAAPVAADRAARLEWYRLRAWTGVLESLPFGVDPGEAGRAWIDARQRFIVYDDSRGRYILRPESIRQAHDRHRGARAAEDLLWLLVSNGYAGECEGLLACYVARTDAAEGEYLRWYPEGRYVDAAVRRILERAAWWKTRVETRYGFDPAGECRELSPILGTLRFGLESARHPDRQKALAAVDAVRWRCQ